ncbi:CAAX protease self-immunity [Seinonella peptonophila]|uniref:CAAX protease self-immunity n=1 Tax=Seinonella peptonophila TaxID=112248 RepID=A0A1M4XVM1_9BACL|nr:CPBP family intramembrane glutamic endopeptidase [Seinonella peptonophila]SHE97468.1 CAAX protease self-immunity [Seinonella peptonophila]
MNPNIYDILIGNIVSFGLFIAYYFLFHFLIQEGKKSKIARYASSFLYWITFAIYFCCLLLGFAIHLVAFLLSISDLTMIAELIGIKPNQVHVSSLHLIALFTWLSALLGMLFFIPLFRRFIARLIPIDPKNRIHTVSLAIAVLIPFQLIITYLIGLSSLNEGTGSASLAETLVSIWSQDILFFIFGMIGVGWLTSRNSKETFQRLGITRISLKHVFLAMGIAVLFVVLGQLVDLFSTHFQVGVDPEVESYTDKLIGPLFSSWFGIFTLGVAAALGEETIFRGALTPRFGIILSSLLFAAVHANYGFSLSSLIVLILGIALGWLRMRYSTTFTMVVHATYNIILGILAFNHS